MEKNNIKNYNPNNKKMKNNKYKMVHHNKDTLKKLDNLKIQKFHLLQKLVEEKMFLFHLQKNYDLISTNLIKLNIYLFYHSESGLSIGYILIRAIYFI